MKYTRIQFKNKWSKLKGKYSCWKTLLSQTGLGWDETKKNINMPESWWKKARKVSYYFWDNILSFMCYVRKDMWLTLVQYPLHKIMWDILADWHYNSKCDGCGWFWYALHLHLLGSQAPCMTQVCYSMPLDMILVPSHILLTVYISFVSIYSIQSHLCSYMCPYLSI
jgi:hypothetical protein